MVRCLDMSSRYIVSGDFGGVVKVWSLERHVLPQVRADKDDQAVVVLEHRSLYPHRGHVTCVQIGGGGRALATGSRDKTAAIQDFGLGEETASRSTRDKARRSYF